MNAQYLLTEVGRKVATSRTRTRQRTEVLLREVHQRSKTLREAKRRFASELAPDFHWYDYMRLNEMGLSRCLADLLDPVAFYHHGKHGQGGLFLDTLIQYLGPRLNAMNLLEWASADQCKQVITEKMTSDGRRIDIVIEFNRGLIAIENKPWANDQKNQLVGYAKYLEEVSDDGKWLLIYLSDHEPPSGSILQKDRKRYESSGKFLRLDYRQTNIWLRTAAEKTRSIKVRFFVEELMNFIQTQVTGEPEMSVEHEIRDTIVSTSENLESAFQIQNTMDSVKSHLLQRLKNQICKDAAIKSYSIKCNERFFEGRKDGELEILFCDALSQNASVAFGFSANEYIGFYFGIKKGKPANLTTTQEDGVKKIMDSLFGCSEEYHRLYPWWIHGDNQAAFGNGFRNWKNSAEPWKAMNDGTLAEKMIWIADRVYESFQKDENMMLLCGDPHKEKDVSTSP